MGNASRMKAIRCWPSRRPAAVCAGWTAYRWHGHWRCCAARPDLSQDISVEATPADLESRCRRHARSFEPTLRRAATADIHIKAQVDSAHAVEDYAMTVKAILSLKSGEVATIEPTASLATVAKVLAERQIGALVVMDSAERLAGILSE